MKTRTQFITVKGLVQKGDEILFVKDIHGWELPGGKIGFGETPEQTLIREFNEELKIKDVQIGRLLHAWTFVSDRVDELRQYIVLVYTCSTPNKDFQLSDEHSEIGWFSKDQVKNLPIRDGYKETIGLLG